MLESGCGSPSQPTECLSNVTVSVSTGLTPRFTWTPACGVEVLSVVTEASRPQGNVVWDIEENDQGMASGVVYGVIPPGTTDVGHPAEPLTAGQSYTVQLYMIEPAGSQTQLHNIGNRSFTPF
jgi:hypothetical protein